MEAPAGEWAEREACLLSQLSLWSARLAPGFCGGVWEAARGGGLDCD